MLHRDVVLEGFAATDWSRMVALFAPASEAADEPLPFMRETDGRPLGDASDAASGFVEAFLDAACPNEHAMVIGVFEGGELWTCVAFSRRDGAIDAIVGKEGLRKAMGLLSGDWRRDYRHLVHAAESRFGKLASGYFAERETLSTLVASSSPGAWARAVAVRDVIISPFPAAMALPLGLDAFRAGKALVQASTERSDILEPMRRLLAR